MLTLTEQELDAIVADAARAAVEVYRKSAAGQSRAYNASYWAKNRERFNAARRGRSRAERAWPSEMELQQAAQECLSGDRMVRGE